MVEPLTEWAVAHVQNSLRITLVIAAAFVLTRVAGRVIRRLERLVEHGDPETLTQGQKRARTLGRILRQAVFVLVWAVATITVMGELGIAIGPLIAGAGIAGLAVGFGAQTLVKDLIAGFFILLENQFGVNDVITVAGVTGQVEAMNLRTTVLRDLQGRVHIIPNGAIAVVTNHTRDWSRALLDVAVPYREDTDRCYAVLKEVGAALETDPVFGRKLAGPFEYPGVEKLDDSAVLLRMMVRTKPHEQWNVTRELRRRVKKALDEHGIEIPLPHRAVYALETAPAGQLAAEAREAKPEPRS